MQELAQHSGNKVWQPEKLSELLVAEAMRLHDCDARLLRSWQRLIVWSLWLLWRLRDVALRWPLLAVLHL